MKENMYNYKKVPLISITPPRSIWMVQQIDGSQDIRSDHQKMTQQKYLQTKIQQEYIELAKHHEPSIVEQNDMLTMIIKNRISNDIDGTDIV